MATLEEQSVTVEQVLARWQEQGIRNVRFELPDMHGTSRSKLVPIEHAGGYAETGLSDVTLEWMLSEASELGLIPCRAPSEPHR